MAKAKAKRVPKKRPKQRQLPGTEDVINKKVEQAADNYHDAMLERVEMSKTESDLKINLISVMTEEGLDRYKMPDGRIVMVSGTKNIKITKPKQRKEQAEE